MRHVLVLAAMIAVSAPLHAQTTVIWRDTQQTAGQAAASAVAGIADQIMDEQQRLRTTPMVHRKIGLRPSKGEEVMARPGDSIVARVAFDASYTARPTADFVNTSGTPIRAEGFEVYRMLNNLFCGKAGRCYDDKDRDGDWDGAGQAKGRWVDVPYIVTEIRSERKTEPRKELVLLSAEGPAVELQEKMDGEVVSRSPCATLSCGGMTVEVFTQEEGGAVRFRVK